MIAWEDYVESNPEVLVGKPVIKGTRLSIEFIMERLANGWTEEEILENYPSLDKNSMQAKDELDIQWPVVTSYPDSVFEEVII